MPTAAPDLITHLSDRHFRSIAELIEREVGIRLPSSKRMMLEGRLQKRVRALRYSDINAYVDHLFDAEHFAIELVHLIDCVTTNKTDFFREPAHFEFMRAYAVPQILHRSRGVRSIKVWSAAASTGMEAYTIAMVLDDMARTGPNFQFRILGTDISSGVLRVAEDGIYTHAMVEPVPGEMARRYLLSPKVPARGEVRVVPELRRSVNFMRMNLMDPVYPVDRDVDIIFCRNVLIYFDKATQRKVVDRLCEHLRPGGYLIVGHSESMVPNESGRLKQVLPTIFQV
ncbi:MULTISPECIES: CheR family methyltransferase [Rhodopseudomonas]|uniref:Chemotaxis protein methyltransferase n=1 Tax=Rhodopseudomonas palustris TaxID=1076 RepID=A0A0D7EJA3_RHOPL|nr:MULTISPECIES: CheR family methyltransferase [Rhodopseudomonas]KIZ40853.1 chemotaxis protein CheR [Rhodopseudomonas palustris]MDF3809394.1 CheR family methyltransferase [Rhodopseudomonas sp. BAL398]WOK16935.1 CheR family methyltransferase [Rhodopseudomonas sp. BAL398]